jgi:site-specific DNA recombinase
MARKSRVQTAEHTRVVGYVRVSSEQQTDHGVSLQAQEEKIRQYCALYDLNIIRA